MAEYIDREAFKKSIKERYCKPCKAEGRDHSECLCHVCWVDYMLEDVECFQTADVTPVVHGRLIEMECLMPHPYYTCSVCGNVIYMEETGDPASDLFTYTYCPQCGAKMDERQIGEDEC